MNPEAATLHVYNTQTRRKELFEPVDPGHVRMYNCGPTVYDFFHVGNARNFVCADIIRRYLAYRGFAVTFVQNITDIEDKIINRAKKEGCAPEDIAEKYTRVFFEESAKLGVQRADHHPRATEYVPKMIEMVSALEQKGFAYTVEGDVYFRVSQFDGYGKLSGRKIDDLLSGARVEVSVKKEHPADFVLWKAAKPGEPSWDSPWGPGRPGWHLECSVMSTDLLGDTFDIHMGGIDLVFPHHENEIAQSEAATGKPFVKYWLHNGFLNINGEKMSKSLGNFFTINDVLAKFEPAVVRYFLLSGHYRAPLDFSDTALEEAKTAFSRLREARKNARDVAASSAADPAKAPAEQKELLGKLRADFESAMDDDFNSPRALAALFELGHEINKLYHLKIEAERTGRPLAAAARENAALLGGLLEELAGKVLGLDLEEAAARIGAEETEKLDALFHQLVPEEKRGAFAADDPMARLVLVRAQARKEKQWAVADGVRNGLAALGFELIDLPGGKTEWKRK